MIDFHNLITKKKSNPEQIVYQVVIRSAHQDIYEKVNAPDSYFTLVFRQNLFTGN
jgi:hypothetical protein